MNTSLTGIWIYFLVFLHSYSQYLAGSSLSIQPDRPLYLMEHAPLELECKHQGDNGHVKWTKDGHEVDDQYFKITTFRTAAATSQGKVQLLTKMTITRNDMILNDSGQYACVIDDQVKAIRVKVLRVKTGSRVITDPGGSITLRCDPATRDVDVFWTKNMTSLDKLPHLKGRVTLENGNTTLKIHNASLADTGQYVCHMKPRDGVMQGNLTSQVLLSGSPYFPDGHNVTEKVTSSKQKLELRCPVQGYPVPKVVWWAEGEKLNTSEKVQLISNDGVSSAILRIKGYYPEIGEHFVCEASNQEGRTRRHFQIEFVNSAQSAYSSLLSLVFLLTVNYQLKSIIS